MRVPGLYCNEKIEEFLNCLKLYYLKNFYEACVDFLFTKNKNSLNSLLNHIPATSPNDHRILGRFFGYPECCIEAMATKIVLMESAMIEKYYLRDNTSNHVGQIVAKRKGLVRNGLIQFNIPMVIVLLTYLLIS